MKKFFTRTSHQSGVHGDKAVQRDGRELSVAAEDGMVTAEYALGTVATTGIAGILIWLSQQDWLRELIADIFRMIVAS